MAVTTVQLKVDSAAGSLLTSVLAIDDTMTLYDKGTTTGMTKTSGLARQTIAAATETKILEAGDYTTDKNHRLYIKNTETSGTNYVEIRIGTIGAPSLHIGTLGFDEFAIIPWSANNDINLICTSAATVVEWMLIFE
jgi:hypothetical protein